MAPPAKFIAASAGVLGGGTVSFDTPAAARTGDSYIAIIATDPVIGGLAIDPVASPTWEALGQIDLANASILFARRIAVGDVGLTLDVGLVNAPAWTKAVLMAYRDIDTAAAAVGASATNINASTNFVCPSRVLTRYSDLYLGVAVITSNDVAVTPPAGTTERYDFVPDLIPESGARHIEVFELLREVVGATGTKTATTAANQSGIAASIALQGGYAPGFGKSFVNTPVGAIGLPRRGV